MLLRIPLLHHAVGHDRGRRPLEESRAFVRWYQQDLQDWGNLYSINVSYHPAFPLRPARALRATLFAETAGMAERFALAVFKAYWSEHLDISDLDTLRALGESVGLNGTLPCFFDNMLKYIKTIVAVWACNAHESP